jgi:hypothetical protein
MLEIKNKQPYFQPKNVTCHQMPLVLCIWKEWQVAFSEQKGALPIMLAKN